MSQKLPFKLALVINPYAGLGGPEALKGSDHIDLPTLLDAGAQLRAPTRAQRFMTALLNGLGDALKQSCGYRAMALMVCPGAMGAETLAAPIEAWLADNAQQHMMSLRVCPVVIAQPSGAADTQRACQRLVAEAPDVLVFVGGDGTARDILDVFNAGCDGDRHGGDMTAASQVLENKTGVTPIVLGVPAGVKMHSGVFALDPMCAAHIILKLIAGQLVAAQRGEVRDIDEQALRAGHVNACYYGELLVPAEHAYIQAVKQGGLEVEELVLLDIASEIEARLAAMPDNTLVILAPGTSTHFIAQELGIEGCLLGFDVVCGGELILSDATASQLLSVLRHHQGPVRLILTPIGGQGHIIGRGNQQLSPAVLSAIGRDNLWLVATKSKLEALAGRPLLIDSDDPGLSARWRGLIPVITGFNDQVLYPLGL